MYSYDIDGELEHAGVCGRLGDLGEIDSYYDVAASTASSALDYIVVETGEGAQKCVEYLKKYNAGRSRFLILEEICLVFHCQESFFFFFVGALYEVEEALLYS